MKREKAIAYRKKIEHAAATQTDEDALESMELYPMWDADLHVKVGERYRYSDKLYKVIQSHTTQSDWTPDITPALWVKVSVDEWPEYVTPSSANPYMAGDKVTFNGKHYICIMNNTVWSPAEYGIAWQLVED